MKHLLILAALVAFILSPVFSESIAIDTGAEVRASTATPFLEGGLSDGLSATLEVSGEFYDIDVNLSASNDGKIRPHSPYQLGHYFFTEESMARIFFGDVTLSAGRGVHADAVESPYAIYINPQAPPALHAEVLYSGDVFSYTTRWVRLNERSEQTYNGLIYDTDDDAIPDSTGPLRDRGMTFKTYTLDFGRLKVGFEDVSLYLDRSFDAETFFSPFPMYFLEMFTTTSGRPWSEVNNTNSLMGFFAEFDDADYDVYGQVLVDDINAGALAPLLGWAIPSLNNITNLSKVAWSLGGNYHTPVGRFGFHHGGALKYTFEATYSSDSYSDLPYEYTYYPITEFYTGSEYRPLDYTENYIGYKYGENNLAFLVDYTTELFPDEPYAFGLYSSLEWVINGSKSPSNPWHEYQSWTEIDAPYELLSDPIVEHTLKTQIVLSKPFKNWLFTIDGIFGYVWNRLDLTERVADEPKLYVPLAGNNHFIASLTLKVHYLWTIRG